MQGVGGGCRSRPAAGVGEWGALQRGHLAGTTLAFTLIVTLPTMKEVSFFRILGKSYKGGLRAQDISWWVQDIPCKCQAHGDTQCQSFYSCAHRSLPLTHLIVLDAVKGGLLGPCHWPKELCVSGFCSVTHPLSQRLFRCLALFLLLQEWPIQNCVCFSTESYFRSFLRGLVGEGLVPLPIRSS